MTDRQLDADTLATLTLELARLARIAATPARDNSPEDRDWFHDHPLRKAFRDRGIITSGVGASAIVEWFSGLLDELSAAEPGDFQIGPPDTHLKGPLA